MSTRSGQSFSSSRSSKSKTVASKQQRSGSPNKTIKQSSVQKSSTSRSASGPTRNLRTELQSILSELQQFIASNGVDLPTDDLSMSQLHSLIQLHDQQHTMPSNQSLKMAILFVFEGAPSADEEDLADTEDEDEAELEAASEEYDQDDLAPEEEEEDMSIIEDNDVSENDQQAPQTFYRSLSKSSTQPAPKHSPQDDELFKRLNLGDPFMSRQRSLSRSRTSFTGGKGGWRRAPISL